MDDEERQKRDRKAQDGNRRHRIPHGRSGASNPVAEKLKNCKGRRIAVQNHREWNVAPKEADLPVNLLR